MAYIVNGDIPEYCNKCPFGMCKFSKPLSDRTHGYTCNMEVPEEGHNKTTMITDHEVDIEKPDWCPLRHVQEHEQIEEWFEELKERRRIMQKYGHVGCVEKEIRNKAIDECLSILYRNAGKIISIRFYEEIFNEMKKLKECGENA